MHLQRRKLVIGRARRAVLRIIHVFGLSKEDGINEHIYVVFKVELLFCSVLGLNWALTAI
jgi:hypothetical protein